MSGACRPRQMLPPPTTTAVSTPRSRISASWRATSPVASLLMPDWESTGANASPESLSRTRLYVGRSAPPTVIGCLPSTPLLDVLAQLVSREAPHGNLLADLRRYGVEQLLHRGAVVPDEGLVEQHDLLQVGRELVVHDLVDDVGGLVHLLHLGLEDATLRVELALGDVVARDVARRRRARDVEREVAREDLELVGVRDEVGLAVELDEHAHRPVEVDVALDHALVRRSPGALRGRREALLSQVRDGRLEVSSDLDQGGLAVHHPGAGRLPELLDLRCGDRAHPVSPAGDSAGVSFASAWGSAGEVVSLPGSTSVGASAS